MSYQADNQWKLQNIFLSVEKKRFDSVQKVHEKFTRSGIRIQHRFVWKHMVTTSFPYSVMSG